MADQKKQFTLDTDWQTAVLVLFGIVFAAFLGIGSILFILAGKISISQEASWYTVITATSLIALVILVPERMLKLALGLLLFGPVVRIITWLFLGSRQALAMNELVGRWASVAACFIFCVYGIQWFRERINFT